MTAAEIEARLVKINAAIDFVLDGNASSAAIAGRSFSALPLETLEELRAKYEEELRIANAGGRRPCVIRFGKASA